MGTPREVSEYGHFVFFLPIIEEPCTACAAFDNKFERKTLSTRFYQTSQANLGKVTTSDVDLQQHQQ